jgi:hypothetical protein
MPSDGGVTGVSSQYGLAGLNGSRSIHRYPSIHNSIHPLFILVTMRQSENFRQSWPSPKKIGGSGQLFSFFK